MIDKFGELTEKDDEISIDKKSLCYICGVSKQ